MRDPILVSNVRFQRAPRELRAGGMRGWVSCTIGGLWTFDSMSVRRTLAGEYCISFPSRVDANGVEHAYYRPLSKCVRDAIEAQVLGELRATGVIP